MKILEAIVKFLAIIIKIIQWMLTNGIPFVRGIIEEIKAARAKKEKRNGT